ncbi:MAG: SDR family NAD(P)-dependent oxidoreductase [Dehalococcoidales bacterium]|jgi:NAD(P)-dependent dehydrogenase (short-subunit alcohol dehydrogenase family)
MKDFKGKTAFITGGASGIGLGIAKACVKYGMKVVIADARQSALDAAMAYFKKAKAPVHPINLNVTDRVAYVRAADEAERVFGKIHLLVSNAGVGSGTGPIDKLTYKDWDYSMGVNVWGCINSMMTIVPRILKHGEGGHIVATSSTCGLMASGNFTIYCSTKAAVCAIIECLATELQDKNIGASVLIPGPTNTDLGRSSFENKPAELRNEGETWPPQMPPPRPQGAPPRRTPPGDMTDVIMDPIETGERVIRGIRNNDLYIHTHPEFKDGYIARHNAIIRAIPDEPRNEKRWEVVKNFGTIIYNDIYDKQQPVGPPDW